MGAPLDEKLESIADTGERMVPEYHKGKLLYGEHIVRYESLKQFISGKRVLDIASGSGYGTKIIGRFAKAVTGVDNNEDAIKYARANFAAENVTYKQGDGLAIPLEDSSVDVVVSLETIEHIEDYEAFLEELKRVLVPDGVAIISTPNDIESPKGNHYHVHEFLFDEARNAFRKHFKNVTPYFQGTWLYTALVGNDNIGTEWRGDIDTLSIAPLKPDQTMYYLFVCSNGKPATEIQPLGAISEHYSVKRVIETESAMRKHMAEQKLVMDHLERELGRLTDEKKRIESHPAWKFLDLMSKALKSAGLKK